MESVSGCCRRWFYKTALLANVTDPVRVTNVSLTALSHDDIVATARWQVVVKISQITAVAGEAAPVLSARVIQSNIIIKHTIHLGSIALIGLAPEFSQ